MNEDVLCAFRLLVDDLMHRGPIPGKRWSHYGKLRLVKQVDKRHCHLLRGKPTYVCCWQVLDKRKKYLEIYYVGTHEKAPY